MIKMQQYDSDRLLRTHETGSNWFIETSIELWEKIKKSVKREFFIEKKNLKQFLMFSKITSWHWKCWTVCLFLKSPIDTGNSLVDISHISPNLYIEKKRR